ncbi:MAG: glycosyltransferase family 2 protein [Phycisphaerales bacterium]|nr:glycosyltransferase family 2 protein [Phycisphaerales bacterium]
MAHQLDFLIPARNAEHTIGDTLASLRAQVLPQWRALIVDDGSTDRTPAAAEAVGDDRISVLRRPGEGVAAARNAAFAATSAELVCFLDADDVVTPGFAQRMTAAIGGSDAVSCAYAYAGPALEPSGWTVTPGPEDHSPSRLAELNPFSIGALVFRREALARLPGPLFPLVSRHEDWEMLLRFSAARARWAPVVPDALFTYRLRPDSRTTGLRAMWLDGLTLIGRYHPSHSEVGPAQRRWTLRSLARAVVREDHDLAADMLARLAGLTSQDEGTLTGALRWALRREVIAGAMTDPGPAGLISLLSRFVPSERAQVLAARAAEPGRYWARIARAAIERLSPARTLVLFGMGRNGRELAGQLEELGHHAAWIDEHSPVQGEMRRLTIADLGPWHTVIITPDDRVGILERLQRTGAEIWLPEDLATPPMEGLAA